MATQKVELEQLEQMAALMAQAIPDLDCPECCEYGWKYQYIEHSAELYQEQYEWAVLFRVISLRRIQKRQQPGM